MTATGEIAPSRVQVSPVTQDYIPSTLGRVMDAVTDVAVIAMAVWTLLAYLTMLLGAPVLPAIIIWLVALPVIGFGRYRLHRGRAGDSSSDGARDESQTGDPVAEPARIGSPLIIVASLVLAIIGGIIAGEFQTHRFDLFWLLGLIVVALAAVCQLRPAATSTDTQTATDTVRSTSQPARTAMWNDLVALAIALFSGGLTLFVLRFDLDDVYYINRAAVVADLGHIPTRDSLLSNGHFAAVGGTGSPVDTIAPLEGGLARLVGLHGATVAYLVEPPIAIVLGVWALWRLVRRWAPRRVLLCFVLAALYLYEAGSGHLSFGNFFLTRIWQGKVVFVTWMLPLLYLYLSEWARAPRRRFGVLIVCACVASLGLTSTATFDVPLIVFAGVLPLLVRRYWSAAALPVAAALFPLVVGVACSRLAPPGQFQTNNFRVPHAAFGAIFGIGLIAIIGAVALWLGPWLVRDRTSQLVVLGSVLVALVALAPKVLFEVHKIINLGGALQRVLWVVPIPALVGLLAAYPPVRFSLGSRLSPESASRLRRVGGWSAAAVVAIAVLVGGSPIVRSQGSSLVGHPTWKVYTRPLSQAGVITSHVKSGVVLAPLATMSAVAIDSGKVKAVDPRTLYTREIPQPKQLLYDRIRLDKLENEGVSRVSRKYIRSALTALKVGTVCVPAGFPGTLTFLRHTGYVSEFSAPYGMTCLQRPPGSA